MFRSPLAFYMHCADIASVLSSKRIPTCRLEHRNMSARVYDKCLCIKNVRCGKCRVIVFAPLLQSPLLLTPR